MKTAVKKTSLIALCAAICFSILRFLQLFFCTDTSSGFFKDGYASFGTEISFVIFIIAFSCFLFAFSEKKVPSGLPQNNLSLSISSVILSIFLIADLIFIPKTYSVAPLPSLFFYVLGIITIFLLLINPISFFFNIELVKKESLSPLLAIIPLVFWLIRTFLCFSFYTELSILSDTVFTIFSLLSICFLTLNLVFFTNDFNMVKTSKRILPFFVITILSCFCSSLPHLIIAVFWGTYNLHTLNINNFTFFGVLIYLIIFYINLFSEKNMRPKIKKHKKVSSLFKH